MRTAPSFLLLSVEAALALVVHMLWLESERPEELLQRGSIKNDMKSVIYEHLAIQAQFTYGQSKKRNNRDVTCRKK